MSNPKISPDLRYWRDELGLPLVTPDKVDEGGYFQSLSWEKADTYPADVFLYDDRVGAAGLKQLDDQPVFQTLDAAKTRCLCAVDLRGAAEPPGVRRPHEPSRRRRREVPVTPGR